MLRTSDKNRKRVNLLEGWKENQTFPEILGLIVSSWRSSSGQMIESMGMCSVGVGRWHPVTMPKVSFKRLSMRRV